MALEHARTIYNGETLGYHRIAHLVIGANLTGRVMVESFPSRAVREKQPMTPYFHWHPVVWQGTLNYIGDAYAYLKTLPEFAGAVDA